MTLQVDDAGWGCPVGGVLIGVYRPETEQFWVSIIDAKFFQGEDFRKRLYLEEAAYITLSLVEDAHGSPEEPIEICSGYVHEKTREWLKESGHPWKTTKVEGKLQHLIERALVHYLASLGFKYTGSTEQYGLLFYQAIQWLKGGNAYCKGMLSNRVAVAKSGWETFQFYRDLPYKQAVVAAKLFKSQKRKRGWEQSSFLE